MPRAQRRKRRSLIASAGPDALFASIGRALEAESVDRRQRLERFADWSSGVLVVGRHGVSFTHARADPALRGDPPDVVAGRERDVRAGEPVRALLRLCTTSGQVLAWRVAGASDLEAALRRLQAWDP